MTTATFYPASASAWRGLVGIGAAVTPLTLTDLTADDANIADSPDGGAEAAAFFDFGSIPADATINWVRLEAKFGRGTNAPLADIYASAKLTNTGRIFCDLRIPAAGSLATWPLETLSAFVSPQATIDRSSLGMVRVDFGGGESRFGYIRLVVDYTPSGGGVTPPSTSSNVVVSSTRTSGLTVVAGGSVTSAVVVANNSDTVAATNVHLVVASSAHVSSRTWVRSDTGATGSGQPDATLAVMQPNTSVIWYITDVIDSGAVGTTYSLSGTVSVGSTNVTPSPMAFSTPVATIVEATDPDPEPGTEFDWFLDWGAIEPQEASYTVPDVATNPNWEIRLLRIHISTEARMHTTERNVWSMECRPRVRINGVGTTEKSDLPVITTGSAAGGRVVGGGILEWERTYSVAPGDVIDVTWYTRMFGNFVAPSTPDKHYVYMGFVNFTFEPRS